MNRNYTLNWDLVEYKRKSCMGDYSLDRWVMMWGVLKRWVMMWGVLKR